ncbi:MAG: 1-acyl-sn-glycerol-3-phosphate acyltransferase [Puniceicoccales bacterium]|jgi:1-acyl-sn-glycerol-3-phosphate acyltransferase|nr:1-acyl-sn-glycerol-3-phosphate acyltransferase [Puniceicoccales bacterium]
MLHPVYQIMCYLFKAGFYELFDGSAYGLENIPKRGAFLLACNHFSYFDPPFLGALLWKREVFSFAKKSLFGSRVGKWLFTHLNSISVDRDGVDISAIRSVLELLQNGKAVMIFPEGTRSVDGKLHKAHAGVGLFACKSGVPVVPCRIFGTYEIMNRFSHFPNFNEKADIIFGKPLQVSEYDNKNSASRYQDAADVIMNRIKTLRLPKQNYL